VSHEAAMPVEELVEELAPQQRFQPYPEYRDSGAARPTRLPERWELRRVKQITRFAYGDALSADNRSDGEIRVFGSNGPVGKHDAANTRGPCLVIGRKGSFGKVNYSHGPCFAIDTTYFIDGTQTNTDIRWLYYALSWLRLDSFSKDSAVPGLAREDAYRPTRTRGYQPLSERHARRVFRRRYSSELPAPTRTRVALPCTTFAGSRRFYLTHTPTLRGFNHVGDLRRRTGLPTRHPQSFPD
jgi:hypothetical protein